MAGLEGNKNVKELDYGLATKVNPVYNVPDHLMTGVEGTKFLLNKHNDKEEIASVVKDATIDVLRRTGGAGFPLLCNDDSSTIDSVKRGVARAGATALFYHKGAKESSELELGEWLERRRSGKEERVLITDEDVSRGWECSHILVVDLDDIGTENLVMRTVGYCALVKHRKK